MNFENQKNPSPEEMAKIEKQRIQSDDELIKGGAKRLVYDSDHPSAEPRIHVTGEQLEKAKEEMSNELEEKQSGAEIVEPQLLTKPLRSTKDIAMQKANELLRNEQFEKEEKEEKELDLQFIRKLRPIFTLEMNGKNEKYRIKAIHNGFCWMERVDEKSEGKITEFSYQEFMKQNPQFYNKDIKDKVSYIKNETSGEKLVDYYKDEYKNRCLEDLEYAKANGYEFRKDDNFFDITRKYGNPDSMLGQDRVCFNAEQKLQELGYDIAELQKIRHMVREESRKQFYGLEIEKMEQEKLDHQKIEDTREKINSKSENESKEKGPEDMQSELTNNERLREYLLKELELDGISLTDKKDANTCINAIGDLLKKYPNKKDFESRFNLYLDKSSEDFNRMVSENFNQLYKKASWPRKALMKMGIYSLKGVEQKVKEKNDTKREFENEWLGKYGEESWESHAEFVSLIYDNFDNYCLIRDEKLQKRIKQCKSFGELYKIINGSSGIQGSRDFFNVKKLKDIIHRVRFEKLGIDYITNSMGLREKVKELMMIEKS